MAPPAPSRNFEQNSPITTILRQICESYPESSCLRELLQNADDAQASEIEYVLDTDTYDDSPLIDPRLRAYHGPALLVKNNNVFTDADFASLASIGDSRKREDPASTGKYGQGFNSCFHWTDGPWILSRQWLLLLDPHREWSTDSGGPTYDILQDSLEIQNHLKSFQRTGVNTSQAVDATVIRIPLRTESQAEKSKIVSRQVTIQEITKALYDLGQEIREGGMLFLRYVRKVTVKIDGNVLWEACTTGSTEEDTKVMQSVPTAFKAMYAGIPNGHQADQVSKTFYVTVTYVEGETTSVKKFLVQHDMIASSGDKDMDTWSRKRKLFPWAAVAAPIDHKLSSGLLFSCLRLPIENGQPVHIHGLFSIVPDRGRLSSSGQMSRDVGSQWNRFMFKTCVVSAWTNLLLARKNIAWQQDFYTLWPRLNLSQSNEPWSSLDDHIIDGCIRRNLPLWITQHECVALKRSYFLHKGDITELYGSAFQAIELPLVTLELPLYQKLLQRASALSQEVPTLTPQIFRTFLKANDEFQQVEYYSPLLLQYCVLDFLDSPADMEKLTLFYNEFRSIRLWPTLQGSLIALKENPVLLPRDSQESELFLSSRKCETLNLELLTRPVVGLLDRHIARGSRWVRHRVISDLELDWTHIYSMSPVNTPLDICARNEEKDELLRRIWGWLSVQCNKASKSPLLSMHNLDNLFLLPLNASRIRKFVCSQLTGPTLILKDADWMQELLFDGKATDTTSANLILDMEILPPEAVELLSLTAGQRSDLALATSSNLKSLLAWLVANKDFIEGIPGHQKETLVRQLNLLTLQQDRTLTDQSKCQLKQHMLQLPIFSQVTATAPYKTSSSRRTTIGTSTRAIRKIEGMPPIPSIPGLASFDPCDTHETNLLDFFDLVEQMPLLRLFFEHIVPHIDDEKNTDMAEAKLRLVNFILEKNMRPSAVFKSHFSKHRLIHCANCSGSDGIRFRLPATTVDPTSTVSNIFFNDEDVFPEPNFFRRHHEVLKGCGIVQILSPEILIERVHTFASSSRDKQTLIVKVKQLFSLSLDAGFELSPTSLVRFRTLKWLPVLCPSSKGYQLVSPDSCRALDDKELVDLVLNIFESSVTPKWKVLLGWNRVIERGTLMKQLDKSLRQHSSPRVDKTLAYLSSLGDCSILRQYPCILSRHGDYILPGRVLLPSNLLSRYPLTPYLDEVEPSFAREHSQLLKELGIRQGITYDDLLRVQSMIVESSESSKLSNENLDTAISLLNISTRLRGDSKASSLLMIPDTDGKLLPRSEIVCGERNVTGQAASFSFVNPKISQDLVEHLRLESSYARATRLGIEIEDVDDDEYAPRENLTTTISDTLGRYTIDSTFSEFLANANDCGATKISWIVDECANGTYESAALLSEELKEMQGPALFVYNNGVFSDRDFQGFKDIGRGGKMDNETSTGMFGRGAMTMYHFTDVPMLISGSFFLILDPQQRLLPRKKITWERKAGVKVPLETARRLFPDQLRPFHGLHGYFLEENFYDGTLYRLPFRSTETTSLKETSALIGVDETKLLLEDYHSTAEMSLLFLRSVNVVEFRIRGQASSWSIEARRQGSSVDDIFQDVDITSCHHSGSNTKTTKAFWRIAMTDIEEAPKELINPGRRANKITECGLAARLQSEGTSVDKLRHQVFCTLPTGFSTQLPVSIHASFAITGDRKTIPFEDTKQNSAITAWNRWLLTDCIPDLYLEFLKDLAPRLGERVFNFWPSMGRAARKQDFGSVIHNAFWDRLAGERYESYQLFPLVETRITIEQSTPLKTRTDGRKRKLFQVASLKSATFDILRETTSSNLDRLFSKICRNRVRPQHLWRDMVAYKIHLKSTIIESQYLCSLFKIEANCIAIEIFLNQLDAEAASHEAKISRDEAMKLLLQITIPDPSSIGMMSGCRVLPKLDQTLGTIRFQSGDMVTWSRCDLLFLPTLVEADLFAANASLLIKPSIFHEGAPKQTTLLASSDAAFESPKNALIDLVCKSSNVRQIGVSDIESFLVHVEPSSTYTTSGNIDTWMLKFWVYLQPRLQSHRQVLNAKKESPSTGVLLESLKLHNTPIYRYHEGVSWHYITPQQFEGGPYVIAPSDSKELDLCRFLPGVKVIDPHCLPVQLKCEERNLDEPQAFSRLLRALTITGTSRIPQLSQESPEYECIKLLRNLIQKYATPDLVLAYGNALRLLPIWLQHSPNPSMASTRCIPAEGALICAHGSMLLPWIRDPHRFVNSQLVVEYSSVFRSFGCSMMKIETVWKYLEPSIPETLTPDQLQIYLPCIDSLAAGNCKPQSKMAPNGYGTLCHTSSLFDHEDEIFLAAFRDLDKNHFLHPDFRHRRTFWKSQGLRARSAAGAMDDSDFLQCILSIEARLKNNSNSEENRRDAAKVTGHLRFARPGFESWSRISWRMIVHTRVYQTRSEVSFEPTYRQAKMASVANNCGPCSIQHAASREQIRVVWSERPLLEYPPDAYVYKFVGPPLLDSVYKHLQHLIEIRNTIPGSELSQYLKDLQATYAFLQDHSDTASISGIRNAKIWLNLPTTDLASLFTSQLDGALRSAKSLCFNAPLDTHVVERAKNFLVPYESLLRRLGCQTMVRPSRPSLASRSNNERPIDHSLTVMRNMQKTGQLTDITFEVGETRISVHKIFMAAASEKFQRQLGGAWGELIGSKSTIKIEDLTPKTLQYIVDFAYTGQVKWPVLKNAEDIDEVADNLDELLDLLRGADRWVMEALHDLTERYLLDESDTYVRPDNVDSVKEAAEEAQAKHLVSHCVEFIRVNQQFVQDCRDMK